MAEKALSNHSYETYLTLEKESEQKYEFHDGFISAMAGGTPEHSLIAGNFILAIGRFLLDNSKNCAAYTSDLRVRIEATNRTYHPDAAVICGKADRSAKDTLAVTNPVLILEVLSDSTSSFDRGTKFSHYRTLPSLREYVLISQSEPMVDTYYRTEEGTWIINTVTDLDSTVAFQSLGCEVNMRDIYRMVEGIG